MKRLAVEEIIGKAESGVTEPYLCRLSDGQLYYVKGRSATTRGLIAEVLCARLAQGFDLPVPDFALATVEFAMLAFDEEAQLSLGAGPAFASLKQQAISPVTPASLQYISADVQRRLFVFDYWVKNEDRTFTQFGGNPNLFLSAPDFEVVVIDHNLAFDPTFDLAKNRHLHVCRAAWADAQGDMLLPQHLRAMMVGLLDTARDVEGELPAEWLDAAPGAFEGMLETLHRCEDDAFWDALNE